MGKLIKATGTPGTTYLRVSHQTNFCYVVNQAGWSLRGQRSQSFHSLHVHILQELVPSLTMGNDVVLSKHGENDYIQVSQLPKHGRKSDQNELELVGIMYYGFHKEFPTSLLSRLYYHRYYIDLCISIFHILDTHINLIRFRRYHKSYINTRLRPS